MTKHCQSKLREWRNLHDLTQRAAAARMVPPVSERSWMMWETGRQVPDEGNMGRLVVMCAEVQLEPNDFYPVAKWRQLIARALSAVGVTRDAA